MKDKTLLILSGIIVGFFGVALVAYGNPANMGLCVACFLRDITGALGFHRAGVVQYMRPEVIGLVLGAFFVALFFKEHKTRGGSSPVTRFVLGVLMMVGALIFLGCPLRMILRLAGGDLNALVGFFGYFFGIWVGTQFLKKGYSLGRNYEQPSFNGYVAPLLVIGLLILLIVAPSFIFFSSEGPGSMYAPWLLALAAGLIVGGLSQRTRLCTMGGFRDIILFRDFHLFSGIAALFIIALVGNMFTGRFGLGFEGQPVAHTESLWNFLGLSIVGIGAVLAGGCPFRQLILAGEGDTDAFITVLGLIFGAAISHNFGLAASPAGVSIAGKVSVGIAFLILFAVGFFGIKTGLNIFTSKKSKSTVA